MKLLSFVAEGRPGYGAVKGQGVVDLTNNFFKRLIFKSYWPENRYLGIWNVNRSKKRKTHYMIPVGMSYKKINLERFFYLWI